MGKLFFIKFWILACIVSFSSCSSESETEEDFSVKLEVLCSKKVFYKQTETIRVNLECTFESENTEIASVDKDGVISGNNIGKTNIIVKSGKQKQVIPIDVVYQYNYVIPDILDFSKGIDYVKEHETHKFTGEDLSVEGSPDVQKVSFESVFNNRTVSITYTFHYGTIYKIRVSPAGDDALDNLYERYDSFKVNKDSYLFYGNEGHRAVYPFHGLYIDYFEYHP